MGLIMGLDMCPDMCLDWYLMGLHTNGERLFFSVSSDGEIQALAGEFNQMAARLQESYAGLEQNTYTFLVDPGANKTEIKEAVQAIWDVRVTSVRTLNRKGKVKRRRWTKGKRPDEKRAIVTLAEGDEIELFDAGI